MTSERVPPSRPPAGSPFQGLEPYKRLRGGVEKMLRLPLVAGAHAFTREYRDGGMGCQAYIVSCLGADWATEPSRIPPMRRIVPKKRMRMV